MLIFAYYMQADIIIPPKGTERYYQEVFRKVNNVEDFFRYFEISDTAWAVPANQTHYSRSSKRGLKMKLRLTVRRFRFPIPRV